MQSPNPQDVVSVLRDDKAGANQRNDSGEKTSRANQRHSRCDNSQLPAEKTREGQQQQSRQRQPAGSEPITAAHVPVRTQVADDAVTPVVTSSAHRRAQVQGSV